jgi:predicted O-linked N-acetylglucosamine transferase (SPINDLY family)
MLDLVDDLYQQGLKLHKSGKVELACQVYTLVLNANPEHSMANHNMGALAVDIGKVEEALPFFEAALEANADVAQFWVSYIDALINVGRIADAQAVFGQAKNNGAQGDGFDKLEHRLKDAGQEPLEANQIASEPQPKLPNILDGLKLDQAIKLAKKQAKEDSPEEAKRIYQDILTKFPKNKRALDGLTGLIGKPIGRVSKAQNPPQDQLQSLINLYSQGQLQQALQQAETLVQQYPNSSVLLNIQGAVLKGLGQLDLSVDAFDKALAIKPDYADAHYNMGLVLQEQGKLEEAIEAYNKALAIKPDYAELYNNMGNALKEQGKLEEAIEAFNKALAIKPDHAFAYSNMGIALQEHGKLEEAIESYNKAIAIKPDYADSYCYMGVALQEQGKLEEAIKAYRKALAIKPDYDVARAQKLHVQAHICDWDSMAKEIGLLPRLGVSKDYVEPFTMLSLEDAPERHRRRSELYVATKYPQRTRSKWTRPSQKPKKLKIGYFSADFHNHATMFLMAQIFAAHDHEHFEVYAYSYGPDNYDEMRQKLITDVDKFYDVRNKSDAEIVDLARADNLDIAIDLKGYTKDERLSLFSRCLAPVQISYLGYPGTLGADFIDYIVADPTLIPKAKCGYYTEQVIYLPHTYQPTDNKRPISGKVMNREEHGLSSNNFVFCCFNQNYKISPKEFDIWMRLLSKVEGSVLWLLQSNEWAEQNLKHQAEARGVSSKRLIFADKIPQAKHLARQQLADLFLDTFNCNAHTTTSDALWAGLPVVTKLGEGFAARVAGSLLNAIGLPELITTTEHEYEDLILELATNPTRLAEVKKKLATNRISQPLFNTELYTKHLENGYQQAYQNYLDGNSPQTITVPG